MNLPRRSSALITLLLVSLLLLTAFAGLAQARTYYPDEVKFLQLINDYRAQHGLRALMLSGTLSEAGARHDLDMGNYDFFSHTSVESDFFPSGSSPWERASIMGYPSSQAAMAENLAAGQNTAQQVFDAWRDSSGHNRNMLGSDYRVIGIARRIVLGSPYGVYWATDFGSVVDSSAESRVTASEEGPFTDVTRSDAELWAAATYVKNKGLFEGYPSGSLGAWDPMTKRHVALVLRRAGLGSRAEWEDDYSIAKRGDVMNAFSGLDWDSGRTGEAVLRSQVVRLLYRAR